LRKLAVFGALAASAIAIPLSVGSSHREAPNISLDPSADNTDVYAFTARDAPNALTVVANWFPNQIPANGPNFFRFDDRARYYVNIDNTGDGKPEIRYRFTFRTRANKRSFLYAFPGVASINDPKLFEKQRYTLHRETYRRGRLTRVTRLGRNIPVAPSNVGPKTIPNYNAVADQAIRSAGGIRLFAGQREDPFFVDLGATFDSINLRRGTGNEGAGKDDFSGLNTQSIVMQIPERQITRNRRAVASAGSSNAVVGVWSSTERRKLEVTNANFDSNRGSTGRFVQVSRLGNPLVNEVVIPRGKKDLFNRTTPDGDAKRFGAFVLQPELAKVMNALFMVNAPERDRTDIVQALLQGLPGVNQLDRGRNPLPTDTLKINLGVAPTETPNRFGVLAGDSAGFPNGRRLEDDVVDIELQVVAGFLKGNRVPLGDGVDRNDRDFLATFPYVAPPFSGFESDPSERVEPPHAPTPAGGR
jgi:hypothetical protein